jgi:glycosyltransferase involved in cell wall biosynthesis
MTTRKRPSVSLAMIVKNERHNMPTLLESVRGCFDKIHITDTGSNDGTVEFLKSEEATELAGCPIEVHHYAWTHDFAAARNASFKPVETDYVVWLDADDSLSDRSSFIHFRDNVMATADYWLATYHYAFNDKKMPVCSFSRERVIRMKKGFEWRYFVHEGCVQVGGVSFRSQQVSSWAVNHRRTDQDAESDKLRNLKLFEEHDRTTGLCPRMTYYYGKEMFDAKMYMEAGIKLLEASKLEGLELHDRIMAIQYACGAALECGQFQKAIQIGLQGVNLMPSRAEYWALLADSHVKQGKLSEGAIFYQAARACRPDPVHGFVALSIDAYDRYPTEQLATIALNQGNMDQAEIEISRLKPMNPARAAQLEADFKRVAAMCEIPKGAADCPDIIITCPPSGAPKQDWDDEMHEKQGLGGSETAAVELAEFWQQTTGRQVVIFNNRKARHTSKSGVSYRPVSELPAYLGAFKPFIHIAWRHATRITNAPSFIWCHDLFTPGAERQEAYDKIICLSEFHRGYVKALQNIPEEKVVLMRNGIEPKHFRQVAEKNPNKIIFPSSPDRGLDRAIEIVKRARAATGRDLELCVFYGFENMRAMGMGEMADRLQALMDANPWVKYHGNVKKDVLAKHFMESAVWVYPADFIETFCITALESMAGGCYALIRNFGGVVDTARPFAEKGMAEIIDCDASTSEELDLWAAKLSEAIVGEKWRNVKVDAEKLSWKAVADEWTERLGLKRVSEEVRNFATSGESRDRLLPKAAEQEGYL